MLRYTAPLALAAFIAMPAAAQDHAGAPAPAAAPMPAAEKNALINAELPADQSAMKSHVMFLASDAMKGREAGTNEFNIAAQYVAAQFYAAGLRPAGDDGSFLQSVPLISVKPAGKGSMAFTPKKKGASPMDLAPG